MTYLASSGHLYALLAHVWELVVALDEGEEFVPPRVAAEEVGIGKDDSLQVGRDEGGLGG
jgi:hypothetical protein